MALNSRRFGNAPEGEASRPNGPDRAPKRAQGPTTGAILKGASPLQLTPITLLKKLGKTFVFEIPMEFPYVFLMKITCRNCNESFDLPSPKGKTFLLCPFCEKRIDIQDAPERSRPQRHPLLVPVWIMAVCTAVFVVIHILVTWQIQSLLYQICRDLEAQVQKLNLR